MGFGENHGKSRIITDNHGFGLIDVPHVLPLFVAPHTTLMAFVLLLLSCLPCLQFSAQKCLILAPQALGLLQKVQTKDQKGEKMDPW